MLGKFRKFQENSGEFRRIQENSGEFRRILYCNILFPEYKNSRRPHEPESLINHKLAR
jgi:hypothetical protein